MLSFEQQIFHRSRLTIHFATSEYMGAIKVLVSNHVPLDISERVKKRQWIGGSVSTGAVRQNLRAVSITVSI